MEKALRIAALGDRPEPIKVDRWASQLRRPKADIVRGSCQLVPENRAQIAVLWCTRTGGSSVLTNLQLQELIAYNPTYELLLLTQSSIYRARPVSGVGRSGFVHDFLPISPFTSRFVSDRLNQVGFSSSAAFATSNPIRNQGVSCPIKSSIHSHINAHWQSAI
jgi:hypothetical protein